MITWKEIGHAPWGSARFAGVAGKLGQVFTITGMLDSWTLETTLPNCPDRHYGASRDEMERVADGWLAGYTQMLEDRAKAPVLAQHISGSLEYVSYDRETEMLLRQAADLLSRWPS